MCCLGSIALCMGEILKEAQRLEAHILDLNNLQVTTGNSRYAECILSGTRQTCCVPYLPSAAMETFGKHIILDRKPYLPSALK